MGKKSKSGKKRADRRERSKLRSEGQLPDDALASQEAAADEAVLQAAKAETESESESESQTSREKKAPKPVREEETENTWQRLIRFFGDVKIEALKINWPSTDETWKSTWVTVFVIIVLSVFMGFCSAGFQKVANALFGIQTEIVSPMTSGAADTGMGSAPDDADETE